jgi:hypothetical protein
VRGVKSDMTKVTGRRWSSCGMAEMWVWEIFEPIRLEHFNRWPPQYVILLEDEAPGPDQDVARVVVAQFPKRVLVAEFFCFR